MLFVPLAATSVEQMTVLVYYYGHHGPATIIMKNVPANIDMDAPVQTSHEKLPGMFIEKWL